MTPQPPGAPPENWQERTDHGTRKVIDHLDGQDEVLAALSSRLASLEGNSARMKSDLKHAVSWQRLTVILGTVGTIVLVIFATLLKRSDDAATQIQGRAAADLLQVRSEVAGKTQNIEAQVGGIYKLLVEQKPREAVKQEVTRKIEKARAEPTPKLP